MFRIDDEINKATSSYNKNVEAVPAATWAKPLKWVDAGRQVATYNPDGSVSLQWVSNWIQVEDRDQTEKNKAVAIADYDKKIKNLTDAYHSTHSDLLGKKSTIDTNVSTAQKSLSALFSDNPETIFDPYQQNYISGYINQLDNYKKAAERQAMFANYRQGVASGSVSKQVNPTVQGIYSSAKDKYASQGDSFFNALRGDYNKAREEYIGPDRYGSNFNQALALNPGFVNSEIGNASSQINSLRIKAADILPNIAGMQNPFAGAQIGAQVPTLSAQTAASSPITGVNIRNPYQPIVPQANKIFPSFTGASSAGSSSSFVK